MLSGRLHSLRQILSPFCYDILQHSFPFMRGLSFLKIFLVWFVVALFDLVHDVEAIYPLP